MPDTRVTTRKIIPWLDNMNGPINTTIVMVTTRQYHGYINLALTKPWLQASTNIITSVFGGGSQHGPLYSPQLLV
jgi:hypothetical protein